MPDRHNVLLLVSDQHNAAVSGYAGDPAKKFPFRVDLSSDKPLTLQPLRSSLLSIIKGVATTAACALWIVAADGAHAAEHKGGDADFFVSPEGNDAWSGKLPEPAVGKTDGPFATLQRAKEAVHAGLRTSRPKPTVVLIRGGEYSIERTVVFGPEDSGTEKAPVIYAAYPGEHPVLSAGRRITGWRKAEGLPDPLPEAARGKVWVAKSDLSSLHSLYNGTKRLPRAVSGEMATATGNTSDALNDQPKKILEQLRKMPERPLAFSKELQFQGNDLQAWSNLPDVEIVVHPGYHWLINILPLASVDPRSKSATLAIPPTYRFKPGNKYKVENALTFLDQPGEWVWHGRERQIYYWPETPLAESDIRAPVLQELVRVEGLEDGRKAAFLSFIGLEFRHNERDVWRKDDRSLGHEWEKYDKGNAFLRFRHAQDCVVQGCRFRAGSGTGIRLDLHCQRIRIDSNELHDLGGTGILLSGYAPGTVDVSKSNIITNNWIHQVGRLFTHSAGIFVTQSGHNQITHNTINDLPYNGIVISGCRPLEMKYHKQLANRREMVSSLRMDEILAALGNTPLDDYIDSYTPFLHARNNLIAQNEVYDVVKQLSDGNPIYLSAMGVGNRIEENYLHDSAGDGGIRLDDQSTFTHISRNVLIRIDNGLVYKADHECRNNFIIDPRDRFQKFGTPGVATSRMEGGTTATNNVYYLTHPDSRAYLAGDKPFYALYDQIEGCVYFGPSPTGREQFGEDLLTGKHATPGKDRIGVLFADPGFDLAAMREKRFVFKADSPALKLGIKPLELQNVGSSLAPKASQVGTDAGTGMAVAIAARRPNIVFILTDDQGYGDISAHGNPVLKTPNLDRLRSESVRFTDFHVSPSCAPTRSALFTGRHEFLNGVTHTIFERERLRLDAITLAQVLKQAGYVTGIFGKWHLGDEDEYQPNRRGFDEVFIHGGGGIGQTYEGSCGDAPGNTYFDPAILHNGVFENTAGFCTDVFYAQALRWMESVKDRGPFFAYIPSNAPHDPHTARPEDAALYRGKVPSERLAHFFGMIHNIDQNVGRVLTRLQEWGIAERTLVVFMNDNGGTEGTLVYNAGMRSKKGSAFLGGTRACSFWRWPGTLSPTDCAALTAHIDFFPTVAEIAGANLSTAARAQVQGRSLVPLLLDPVAPWPERLLFTHRGRWPKGADPSGYKFTICSIRTPRWHLVSVEGGADPRWMLFDVSKDYGETTNVSRDHGEVVKVLEAAYEGWWAGVQPHLVNETAVGPKVNPFKERYCQQFGATADPRR